MAEPRPRRAAVASWALYDLANSAFLVGVVGMLFPLWVTKERGGNDADVAYTLAGAMLFLLVAGPLMGAFSDQAGKKLPFLAGATVVSVVATLFLGTGGLLPTLVYFAIAVSGFHVGQVLYNALLPDVSTKETRGFVSGLGIGVGYFGSLAAAGIAIGVADNYQLGFKALTALFLLVAIPLFVFLRERPRLVRHVGTSTRLRQAVVQLASTVRSTRQRPGLRQYLLARMLFTLSINTASVMAILYGTDTLELSEEEVKLIIAAGILVAIPAAFVWGLIVDRRGPKLTLTIALWGWLAVFLLLLSIPWFGLPSKLLWPIGIFIGIFMAGMWTADRPFMYKFIPEGSEGEFIGLQSLTSRASAVIGPFMWGLIAVTLGFGQPAALVALGSVLVLALMVLQGVDDRSAGGDSVVETPAAVSRVPEAPA